MHRSPTTNADVTRVVAIADLHLSPADEPPRHYHGSWDLSGATGRLEASLRFAQAADPDLLFVLGDITQRGDVPTARSALAVLAREALPTRIVAGNHDRPDGPEMLSCAVTHLARPNVRMAGITPEPVRAGVALAGVELDVHRSDGTATFTGQIDPSAWPQGIVVLLSHFPLISRRNTALAKGLSYPSDLANHAQLAASLALRRWPTIALTAHTHLRDSASQGRLLQIGCGPQIEAPYEANVVDIQRTTNGAIVHRDATPIGALAGGTDPSLVPTAETWTYHDATWTRGSTTQ